VLISSGYFGAGFDEGEPLIAEVGNDLQAAAGTFATISLGQRNGLICASVSADREPRDALFCRNE
jgi:hypothetical protein